MPFTRTIAASSESTFSRFSAISSALSNLRPCHSSKSFRLIYVLVHLQRILLIVRNHNLLLSALVWLQTVDLFPQVLVLAVWSSASRTLCRPLERDMRLVHPQPSYNLSHLLCLGVCRRYLEHQYRPNGAVMPVFFACCFHFLHSQSGLCYRQTVRTRWASVSIVDQAYFGRRGSRRFSGHSILVGWQVLKTILCNASINSSDAHSTPPAGKLGYLLTLPVPGVRH